MCLTMDDLHFGTRVYDSEKKDNGVVTRKLEDKDVVYIAMENDKGEQHHYYFGEPYYDEKRLSIMDPNDYIVNKTIDTRIFYNIVNKCLQQKTINVSGDIIDEKFTYYVVNIDDLKKEIDKYLRK